MARVLLWLLTVGVVAIGLDLAFHLGLLGFIIAVVLLAGGPLGWARFEGRRRDPASHWQGYVSFYEDTLRDQAVFPHIVPRSAVGGWGRKGLSSGKCFIDPSGLRWKSGGWATPQTRIKGTVRLPWSEVQSARAFTLPGKVPVLGGGLEIQLTENRGLLSGEFLGSLTGLDAALRSAVTSPSA